jgi:hypothetical protein
MMHPCECEISARRIVPGSTPSSPDTHSPEILAKAGQLVKKVPANSTLNLYTSEHVNNEQFEIRPIRVRFVSI